MCFVAVLPAPCTPDHHDNSSFDQKGGSRAENGGQCGKLASAGEYSAEIVSKRHPERSDGSPNETILPRQLLRRRYCLPTVGCPTAVADAAIGTVK
jgi:hypothetical protein